MSRKLRLFVLCVVLTLAGSSVLAQAQADLSVEKNATPDPVAPGANLTYAITVNNEGPQDATTVTLDDPLPAGTTFQSLSSPGGWSCTTPAVGASGTVNCSTALLAVGSAVFTVVVQVGAAVPLGDLISNTATAASATTDPNPGNESATAVTPVATALAQISIEVLDAPDPVTAGYDVTYTITTSTVLQDVTDALLTAPVPTNSTFRSFTPPGGWSCVTPAVGATGTVSCSSATLPAGDSVFTLVVRVSPAAIAGTFIIDTATIEGVSDGRPIRESDAASTRVAAATVLSATKTFAGPMTIGSALTYTIVLTNEGPGAQADNAGDELSDVLPAGLTLVSASATAGTAVATIGTNTVTWNGALGAGSSVTITIQATIGIIPAGTLISNQANLAWDGDGDGTNDVNGVSDDPLTAAQDDATAFAVAATPVIPATGPFGLAMLMTLLALCGAFALRRLG